MLPMIGDVSEFSAARSLIDRELTILKRHGRTEPKKLLVGAMIEVPALLWQLDRVLPLADFASVGSNDLMQFLFATDRGNMLVADRFDNLNPAGLMAMRVIVEAAARHGVLRRDGVRQGVEPFLGLALLARLRRRDVLIAGDDLRRQRRARQASSAARRRALSSSLRNPMELSLVVSA